MKLHLLIIFTILVLSSPFLALNYALADCTSTIQGAICLENPIGPQEGAGFLVPLSNIVKYSMGIMGALAFFAFVYGGFNWLISAGNAEKVKTGFTTMMWAAMGLFIIFFAYAILRVIITSLTGVS